MCVLDTKYCGSTEKPEVALAVETCFARGSKGFVNVRTDPPDLFECIDPRFIAAELVKCDVLGSDMKDMNSSIPQFSALED